MLTMHDLRQSCEVWTHNYTYTVSRYCIHVCMSVHMQGSRNYVEKNPACSFRYCSSKFLATAKASQTWRRLTCRRMLHLILKDMHLWTLELSAGVHRPKSWPASGTSPQTKVATRSLHCARPHTRPAADAQSGTHLGRSSSWLVSARKAGRS